MLVQDVKLKYYLIIKYISKQSIKKAGEKNWQVTNKPNMNNLFFKLLADSEG